jgi:CDP-paratose 2-epimerase
MAAFSLINHARGQPFNVGGGISNSLSLLELFTLLEELAGVKLNYTIILVRESDQRVFQSDLAKANKLLCWQPAVASRQGIVHMYEWGGKTQ